VSSIPERKHLMQFKKGDRVRLESSSTEGTVNSAYAGMRTGTLYALVQWQGARELTVVKQEDLVKIT
jgi:ribosomal protein L21E